MNSSENTQKISVLERLEREFPQHDREEFYTALMCREIKMNNETMRTLQQCVHSTAVVEWVRPKFVSRGGRKLWGVLERLDMDVRGWVCLDAGASTGGFTDCLLQRGARAVHSVDVGYNQLAWKLRKNTAVHVMEKTNVMELSRQDLEPVPDFATADLSFRSLRGVASRLLELVAGPMVLVLVKPQFEAEMERESGGVLRFPAERAHAVTRLVRLLNSDGVVVADSAPSVPAGRKGNKEVFLVLRNDVPDHRDVLQEKIKKILNNLEESSKESGESR